MAMILPSLGAVVRSRRLSLVALALLIGVGAGYGAVAFRFMVDELTWLFTGYADYTAQPGARTDA